MKADEKNQFIAMLVTTSRLYEKSLDQGVQNMYWQSLKHLPWDKVKIALKNHIQDPEHGRWFPKPADLMAQINKDNTHQAEQAWQKVYQAICKIGAYQAVQFDDPLIHVVISSMGGWIKLCHASTNQLLHEHRQAFINGYKQACQSPVQKIPHHLTGIFSHSGAPKFVGTKADMQSNCEETHDEETESSQLLLKN